MKNNGFFIYLKLSVFYILFLNLIIGEFKMGNDNQKTTSNG